MKLNKLLAMSAIVACGLTLASCGETKESPVASTPAESTPAASTPAESTPAESTPAEVKVSVGVGYDASYDAAKNQVDLAVAFAAFDADGKIQAARLDVVQVKVKAEEMTYTENEESKTGYGLVLDVADAKKREDGAVKTKLEQGTVYGMLKASAIKKEVDSQIEAYAAWTVGKTAAQLAETQQLNEESGHTVTTDTELAASCSISVNQFSAAFAKAYENKSATLVTLEEGAKAGVAINGKVAYNYGKPSKEVSIDFAGALVAGGKIVAASVDAVVASFNIADDGALSLNTSAKYHNGSTETEIKFLSKKTLKEAYGMASASPIGAEWYTQAASLEAYAAGKTADQVGAGEGLAEAGVTITSSSYTAALKKAAEYSQLEHVGPQPE